MNSTNDILNKLFSLQRFGIKPGLERTSHLLDYLGAPQEKYHTVHIAGTNGKGSVASCIASILMEAGYKTGLYTSPHISDFNERIRVNGQKCTNSFMIELAEKLMNKGDKIGATFFEITTAMAFDYFAMENVDIAVIETGMGGRFDSTNVITPLLSIITNVDIDHSEYLGNTIEKIAFEKAGIIKPGITVITAESKPEALNTIANTAKNENSELLQLNNFIKKRNVRFYKDLSMILDIESQKEKYDDLFFPLAGKHQADNIGLSVLASEHLESMLNITKQHIYDGIRNIKQNSGIVGRIELIRQNPPIILDVSHNPAAVNKFVETLDLCGYSDVEWDIIFGAMSDKDYAQMLKLLSPICKNLYCVQPDIKRAATKEEISNTALRIGFKNVEQYDKIAQAFDIAINRNNPLLILGSFYVAEEAVTILKKN